MQIVIDGQTLDISQDEKVAITLTANSLEDASFFQSSYTNAFAIPPTIHNKNILGDITGLDVTGTEYLATDVQLFNKTGLPILSNGKMLVNQFDGSSLSVNIIDGIVGFFDELGDTQLSELDLTAYTHTWDLTTAVADANNSYTDGYTYAILNYGNQPRNGNDIDVRELLPVFYAKKLFLEIASQISTYTFSEDYMFVDPMFEALALAYNGVDNTFLTGFEFSVTGSAPASTISSVVFTVGSFIAPSNRTIDISFDIVVTTTAGVGGAYNYKVEILSDINGVLSTNTISGTDGLPPTTVNLSTSTTSALVTGEVISGRITITSYPDASTSVAYDLHSDNPVIEFGETLAFGSLMPDMSCADFIKNIIKFLGVQLGVDSATKIITLRGFEEYSTDIANAVDYSSKIDILQPIEVEYEFGNYGKINRLEFKEDDAITNSEFANDTITITNANLQEDYEMVTLDFGASNSDTAINSQITIAKVPIFDSDGVISNELEARLIYVDLHDVSLPVGDYTDGTSTTTDVDYSVAKFIDSANASNLGFLNTIKTDRFAQFELMLQSMQKVTASFKLTDNEINDIDFFTLIYLNVSVDFVYLSGYYLLQKVKEYAGDETVQIELINVNIT